MRQGQRTSLEVLVKCKPDRGASEDLDRTSQEDPDLLRGASRQAGRQQAGAVGGQRRLGRDHGAHKGFLMRRLLAVLAATCVIGCVSRSPVFLSGTKCSLGAYIPWSDNLYGITLIDFTTGTYMRFPTNSAIEVQHQSASTNNWMWSMLDSRTSSSTKSSVR